MFSMLVLLSLVLAADAPLVDEPFGAIPQLQFVKWEKGAFLWTAEIVEPVTLEKTVELLVNGQTVTQKVTEIQQVKKTVTYSLTPQRIDVYDIDGKKVAEENWPKAIGNGAVIAIAPDGKIPHPTYCKAFKEGTLIVVVKDEKQLPKALPRP